MERKLLSQLNKWKESQDRKPLIIKGVRQCGKTYLLKEFGANQFEDVAYFNFEGNIPLQQRFDVDMDVERIITELGILRGRKIIPGVTLLIFDEIQFCNSALTALKYFHENAPQYHIACAGSLLGIALSKPLSFPVGKVDFLTLYPMNFNEFLKANGETMLAEYLENIKVNDKISELFEEKLDQLLKTYYITGGMPEAVKKWVDTKNVEELEVVQQRILDSYELDFAKHAPGKDFPKLAAIWRSIPGQLAKENTKFVFSQVKQGYRAKDLEDALEWLISAGLVYKVVKIEKPFMPMSAYADQTSFKLYLADVGLLRKMSNLNPAAILEKNELFKEFKGALTENFVLCELVSSQKSEVFYWKSTNIAEVDFVVQIDMDIVPIEVKSEKNVRAKSLGLYRKAYNPRVAVIASMNNIRGMEVRSIPLYLIGKVRELI